MMIKGLIHQKDVTVKTIYVLNIGPSKYTKQILTLLKGERDNSIIIIDFKTSLSLTGCKTRPKISKT